MDIRNATKITANSVDHRRLSSHFSQGNIFADITLGKALFRHLARLGRYLIRISDSTRFQLELP